MKTKSLGGISHDQLYDWITPNGHKITVFLEEAEIEDRIISVNISAGEQFKPAFLAISPNTVFLQ